MFADIIFSRYEMSNKRAFMDLLVCDENWNLHHRLIR